MILKSILRSQQTSSANFIWLTMIYRVLLPVSLSFSLAFSLDPREQFVKFKIDHAKNYANIEEEQIRFNHFANNLKKIEIHNAEGHSWRMGITKFADLSKYGKGLTILNIKISILL